MMKRVYYFLYLLVISILVYVPGTTEETASDHAFHALKDSLNEDILQQEMCNDANPCRNGGTCHEGACKCPKDYTGSWCETPEWCTGGKCGYGSDVECVWDRKLQEGECRCKKENYCYLPKHRKCYELDCGDHGSCQLVDDVLACKCEEKYALKSSKCEHCDCDDRSEKCSFNSGGDKVCQCQKGYASKTTTWSAYGTWCEVCDCGEHGKCQWNGDEKICDCEDGYRSFYGKCTDCNCGQYGTCQLNGYGEKVCTCDYGYAEKDGTCQSCDCNLPSRRHIGINCTFVKGRKQCICPPGYETGSDYCKDINECYRTFPCPDNTLCINKPGTFECKCREGFQQIDPTLDVKLSGCKDIDECFDFPCQSPATRCVNSPGSYDCVCKDGYYATAGNEGSSYKPAYNTCYEIQTQWREATIAFGVLISVGITGIIFYIQKHKSSS